jgi:hypothetical protein
MRCRNLRLFRKFNNFRPKPYLSRVIIETYVFFCEIRKKIFFFIFENFCLKRSCLTRGIQRCQIHRSKSLNNGVMAVSNSKILNGHSSVIKKVTAMNFTPLDSSRQRASFEIKIFAKFAKNYIF